MLLKIFDTLIIQQETAAILGWIHILPFIVTESYHLHLFLLLSRILYTNVFSVLGGISKGYILI